MTTRPIGTLRKEAREIIRLIPRYARLIDNAKKRSDFEFYKTVCIRAASVLNEYEEALQSEVYKYIDHGYSLEMIMDMIDKTRIHKEELITLYHNCENVIELDDVLHHLAVIELRPYIENDKRVLATTCVLDGVRFIERRDLI